MGELAGGRGKQGGMFAGELSVPYPGPPSGSRGQAEGLGGWFTASPELGDLEWGGDHRAKSSWVCGAHPRQPHPCLQPTVITLDALGLEQPGFLPSVPQGLLCTP